MFKKMIFKAKIQIWIDTWLEFGCSLELLIELVQQRSQVELHFGKLNRKEYALLHDEVEKRISRAGGFVQNDGQKRSQAVSSVAPFAP